MAKFVKRCTNALNDGRVEKSDPLYSNQFSKSLYIISLVFVVGAYASVTYYASELYTYIGK